MRTCSSSGLIFALIRAINSSSAGIRYAPLSIVVISNGFSSHTNLV
jgi:hypothetical protein